MFSKAAARLNYVRKSFNDHAINETPLLQRVYRDYVANLQNRVGDRSTVLKQRFLTTESKFNESSEKKSLIANEWMIKDQEINDQLKIEKDNHVRAKAAYLNEFIGYNKNVRTAQEIASSIIMSDEEILNLVLPLESQKQKLDQLQLDVAITLNRVNQLTEMRSEISLAQEFKSIKDDHMLISGDYRKFKNSFTEIDKIWKKSQELHPTKLENLSPWRKNLRFAENFILAMGLSLHLKLISSKEMN